MRYEIIYKCDPVDYYHAHSSMVADIEKAGTGKILASGYMGTETFIEIECTEEEAVFLKLKLSEYVMRRVE